MKFVFLNIIFNVGVRIMPYIASKKTSKDQVKGLKDKEGRALDRKLINEEVIKLSKYIATRIDENNDIIKVYLHSFSVIGSIIEEILDRLKREDFESILNNLEKIYISALEYIPIIQTIMVVSYAYGYQGAFLGELNYAITRLIQEVPKRLVEQGKQKSELKYLIYVLTISALIRARDLFFDFENGIDGVFEDVKDEYKRRVNTSYEAAQIVKSGDCYDTPYYTKLIKLVDQSGKHLGYQEIMIKRENDNGEDIFKELIVITK